MKKSYLNAKKIAVIAILTCFALVSFILESLIATLPGAKLGLANIFSLIALVLYSPAEAFAVVTLRTLLGSIFAGNFSALLYSFTAGVVSTAISSVLLYFVYPKISFISISVLAAAAHNSVQYLVFVLLSGAAFRFGFFAFYLLALATLSGAATGLIITLVFRSVPYSVFERLAPNLVKEKR